MNTKQFHIGEVLSVTTGKMLSRRGMDGIYDILNFITGNNIFTHQIPRVLDECAPAMLKQFPQLTGLSADGVNPDNIATWIESQAAEYGEYFSVAALAPGAHHAIDPISELAERVHPSKIIVVAQT